MLKSQEAMRRIFDGLVDRAGDMPPLPGIYAYYSAPITRNSPDGRELAMARWGMPTPPQYLVGKRTDPGVTNIRRVSSSHWRPWLGTEHRCLIPFTSSRRTNCSQTAAGLRSGSPSMRAGRSPFSRALGALDLGAEAEGGRRVTAELVGLLTTEPNAEVAAVHPKAMPAILNEAAEWETWLTAPWSEAKSL
jgi:putative SOS response-associated peptidase YedK